MYHRPVCVNCKVEMIPKNPDVGLMDHPKNGPNKLWKASLWICPECQHGIIIEFPAWAMSYSNEREFQKNVKCVEAYSQLFHCYPPNVNMQEDSEKPIESKENRMHKNKETIQTSCSELLVDTTIKDPEIAFRRISKLMEKFDWESSPPMTLDLLKQLKHCEEDETKNEATEITIFDAKGNRTYLEYGYNGYVYTGYRFDTQCNHGDVLSFPIFKTVIEELHGKLIACDGGSESVYNDWLRNPEEV